MPSNTAALQAQNELIGRGFLVGAIRQPTVERPILRVIPRVGVSTSQLEELYRLILRYKTEEL
jgi:8-amino-7-oxononanoate synthase